VGIFYSGSIVSPRSELPGIVELEVSVNNGAEFTSNGVQYMYEIGAEVHDVMPSRSLMGTPGQTVTVTGQYFEMSSGLSCWFGDSASVSALYVSSTNVMCKVPERGLGTVYLTVSSNGLNMGQTQGSHFEYVSAGKILSVTPSTGPVSGSTVVTLKGVHLTAVSDDVKCRFAGRAFPAVKVSETEVECSSPENSVEEMMEVSLVWDAASVQASNALEYFYHAHVSIERLQPTRGPTAGETLVTVVGTGFREQGLSLRMGTRMVSRGDVMWASSTKVLVTAPVNIGTGKLAIEASVNDGADFTSNGREYLYEAGATADALVPSRVMSGKGGQVVTIVGQHFAESGELSCRFGDSLAVNGLYMSSTMVACTAPLRTAGAVMVSVSNNAKMRGQAYCTTSMRRGRELC